MNREIKFRVWNKVDKCWQSEEHFAIRLCGDKWFIDDETAELIEIKNENNFTLMQYTGLTDKNGKEIWEGDVMKWNQSHNVIVEFQGGKFGGRFLNHVSINMWVDLSKLEIIGNIFENESLLNQTKGAKDKIERQ
jgi:uncharacterized phage protein (TIGR01671 family)